MDTGRNKNTVVMIEKSSDGVLVNVSYIYKSEGFLCGNKNFMINASRRVKKNYGKYVGYILGFFFCNFLSNSK